MPHTRLSWILAALASIACSGSSSPPVSEPEPASGLSMPAAEEFVAISDPSYGYASFAADAPGQGEQAPDFELPTHTGETASLYGLLAEGPVVLMFYRGFW